MFVSLNLSNKSPYVNIVYGTQSPVLGNRVVQAIPSLALTDIIYILKFLISLLSISQFTKKITFSLPAVFFRTNQLGGGLVQGMREDACTIWTTISPTGFIADQLDPILLWN